MSLYTSSGPFIKCFSTRGSGEGELDGPKEVAVDNTTGALYVGTTTMIVLLCTTNIAPIFIVLLPGVYSFSIQFIS